MSETLYEWIIVWTFFLLAAGFTFAEAARLSRKGWADFGKSLAFSALSNFIGFALGFFVLFVAFAIVLGMTLDEGSNKYPTEYFIALVGLGLAVVFVPVLLTICKRIFLAILKIQTGKPAWLYSIVNSILILVISLGIPILIAYFVYR